MKIAIGSNIIQGPWGGGNQFAKALATYLSARGWQVYHHLNVPDLDIILLTEPRKRLQICAFNHPDIARYVLKHPKCLVVHRVNECDERKGTIYVNALLMEANEIADYTIFISDWLRTLFTHYKSFDEKNSRAIRNGADTSIFHAKYYTRWDKVSPLKLVTHHWGGQWEKGFDIYQLLDRALEQNPLEMPLEFTYIGNLPKDFAFQHASVIAPLGGEQLARELNGHHVYLTGSLNEPGGMHHIEGCLCGLPPLFIRSGAITEHCEPFGIGFSGTHDFWDALNTMSERYDEVYDKMSEYPYTAEYMCRQYEDTFLQLMNSKPQYLKKKIRRSVKMLWKHRRQNFR